MKESKKQSKQELLSFIKWKLKREPDYLNQQMPYLKEMDYYDLREWAISEDIIDARRG